MQRRQCLAALGGLAAALPAVGLQAAVLPAGPTKSASSALSASSTSERRELMGTQVDLHVAAVPPALAREAMDAAWQRMAALAALMSRFEAGNPLSQLAAKAGRGQVLTVSPELGAVLAAARQRASDTQGLYDPTVGSYRGWDFRPGQQREAGEAEIREQRRLRGWQHLQLDASGRRAMLDRAGVQLDLGGAAKLPILEAGLQVLRAHGVEHALINGGGDVLTLGRAAPDRAWRVALRDPRQPQRWLGVLDMPARGAVLAASGDYERGFDAAGRHCHHILDPRTGQPTQGLHGLALLAERVADVNAWGPAMMVGGAAQARRWARGLQGVELMLAGPGEGQGREALWMSSGLTSALRRA